MTRKQLTDPFGSDDEEEACSPTCQTPQTKQQIDPVTDGKQQQQQQQHPQKQQQQQQQQQQPSEAVDKIQRDSQVPSLLSLASPVKEERQEAALSPPTSPKDAKAEELKERARKLLEQTKREAVSPAKSLAKQGLQVQYRARRLVTCCIRNLAFYLPVRVVAALIIIEPLIIVRRRLLNMKRI